MNTASPIPVWDSRTRPWPDTIHAVLDRAAERHGDDLVVIEGASIDAAQAAHHRCAHHRPRAWRHHRHPARTRRGLPPHASEAVRNQHMRHDKQPRLVLALHQDADPGGQGSTTDLCQHALTIPVPVRLATTNNPDHGSWPGPKHSTGWKAHLIHRHQPRTPAEGSTLALPLPNTGT